MRTQVVVKQTQPWTLLVGLGRAFGYGRAFRIVRGKDNRWTLYRITEISDQGKVIGTCHGRRDANKALEKIAYASDPQW